MRPGMPHAGPPNGPPTGPSAGPAGPPRLPYPPHAGGGQPGQPATASGPVTAPVDRTGLYLNILLGVAALLMITAAIIFITVASSTVVKAVSLWVVAVVFHGAGLGVYSLVAKLRPVGFALTAIGLAIIPIAGFGLGGWQLTSGTAAWFISSAAGVLAYLGAAVVLRSQLVTWLSVAFTFSLTMSAIALTPAPVVWYFVVLILTTAPLALLAVLLRGRLAEKYIRPQIVLGDVLAPLAVAGAVFIDPVPTRLEWGILFAALGVHFLVGALLRRSPLRGVGARFSFALAILLIISGLTHNEVIGLHFSWERPLTTVAALLIGAVFFTESALRRPARRSSPAPLPNSSELPAAMAAPAARTAAAHIALILAGGFLYATGIVLAEVPHTDPGETIATILVSATGLIAAGAAVFAALRADALLPLGAGIAVAARVGAFLVYQIMHHGPEDAPLGDQLPSGVATSAGFIWHVLLLIGLAWLSSTITSRRARHLTVLRAGMPPLMPAAALLLLIPAPMAAADIDSPVSTLIVVASVAALGLCAWWARNALLVTGAVPVALAFGYVLGDIWKALGLGSSVTSPIVTGGYLIILAAALAGLALAEVGLRRRGRTWRARYAVITAGILAAFFGFGLLFRIVTLGIEDRQAAYIAGPVLLFITVGLFAAGHWASRRLAAAGPGPGLRYSELRLLPLSISAVAAFLASVLIICLHSVEHVRLAAAIVLLLLAAVAFAHAFAARAPEVVLLGFLALYHGIRVLAGLGITEAALAHLLAAWLVWMLAYALYWFVSAAYDRKPGARHLIAGFSRWSLAPLIAAFAAMLTAFISALLVDAEVPALHSLTMLIAGITLMMPAFMLVLLAQRFPHQLTRRITAEVATYIGAVGGMITLAGIWQLRLVVPLHVLLAAAIGWAIFSARRQPVRSGPGAQFVSVDLRTVIPMAFITLTGTIAAFTADHAGYSLLFLIDHAALLITGAVLLRAWALWWGLAGVSAGIVWFLRDLMWLALVIIAVFIIGVVIWQLLRKPKSPEPQGSPVQEPPQNPPHAGPARGFGPPHVPPRQGPPPPAPPRPPGQVPSGPGQVPGGPGQPPSRERNWQPPAQPPPAPPSGTWQEPRHDG